jgi:hypothetical protein
MKKIYTILAALLLTAITFAQTPEKMSYQAIVRDNGDNLVVSQSIGIQISVLQGSASGTAVYTETQTPSTNVNGLVTLEIGSGTTTDDFSTIDWSTGPYFIKTETDPTGGTSYTITGTSQLLSVPYALYAKKSGSSTETDPIYSSSAAANINNADISNWNNKLETEVDGSVTNEIQTFSIDPCDRLTLSSGNKVKIPGIASANNVPPLDLQNLLNSGMSVCDIQTQYDCIPNSAFYGLNYEGGIIFLVQGCSGYVAAPNDQSSGTTWWNGTPIFVGIPNNSYGSVSETSNIVSAIGVSGNYAASLCDDLVLNGYSDWFLPGWTSIVYMKSALGPNAAGILSGAYWCSWENNDSEARYFVMEGSINGFMNKGNSYKVRAVRKF